MERIWKGRLAAVLMYALMIAALLFVLYKVNPLFMGVYRFLEAVLGPFVIAMIISYVLNPIVELLSERKVPRSMAVLIIYALFFVSVAVILLNVIPMIVRQVQEFNEQLPDLMNHTQNLLDGLHKNPLLPDGVRRGIDQSFVKIENGLSESIMHVINQIGSTINVLFILFIIPFVVFYMLKDFHLLSSAMVSLIPKAYHEETVKMLKDMDEALGSYVRGQLLVCLIIGVLAYFGYWIIGMPYPLLLACVVAVFNIIPYLGPFFGAAPALVMALTVSWKMVLLVLLVNTVIQILEGNVISPQVVGRSLHMHPLTLIFVLLAGGEVAGIFGLIFAVPLYAAGKVIWQHFGRLIIKKL